MEINELEAKVAELEEKLSQQVAENEKLSKNYANQKARAEKAEKALSKNVEVPDFNEIIDQKLSIMATKKEFLDKGIPKELVDQFIVSADSTIPEHLIKPWVQPDVPEPKQKENDNAPELKTNVLELFSEEE